MPPNPFRDAGPWGQMEFNGVRVPGVIRTIGGAEKPEEWNVQKGSSGNNADLIWKGTKLAEGIEIETILTREEAFDGVASVLAVLRPKIGEKPPSVNVVNPSLAWAGITRVALKSQGTLTPRDDLAWSWKFSIIEYNPSKPAAAGQASPAKPPDAPEQTPEEKAFAEALDRAAKAGEAA